ncbi:hypothetical protein BX600DRAFT_461784 [Xylariales sp. PMI_506]|nr:hypothetical protein BX600DRAFT_461784 [Xylariales sp. PMI_506]
MAHLLDLPAELRQYIILLSFTREIPVLERVPKYMFGLLWICRLLRADVIQTWRTWCPTYILRSTIDILMLHRCNQTPRVLSFQIFSSVSISNLHSATLYEMTGRLGAALGQWTRRVAQLPKYGIKSLVVDLTAVPQWVLEKRPDWVPSLIADRRSARSFLAAHQEGVVQLVERLNDHFNTRRKGNLPPVPIAIGGQFGWRSEPVINSILEEATQKLPPETSISFVGSYHKDSDLPVGLSLQRISDVWGVGGTRRWGQRSRRNDMADFSVLGFVRWSSQCKTYYHENAVKDQAGTLQDLERVLMFAITQKRPEPQLADYDFDPAPPLRRKLIHNLCEVLEITTVSLGKDPDRFVKLVARTPT